MTLSTPVKRHVEFCEPGAESRAAWRIWPRRSSQTLDVRGRLVSMRGDEAGGFVLIRILFFISTKARTVNPAVDSGSTNHLSGHRTSDHDSFFRRPDESGEQAAQSA